MQGEIQAQPTDQNEETKGDDEDAGSEGDEGLQQYCEPELNAVQELEAESKESFNVEAYLLFKK